MFEDIEDSFKFLDELGIKVVDNDALNDLRIIRDEPSIVFVGLIKRGKSTLVNNLVGESILPIGINPETFACTVLKSTRGMSGEKLGILTRQPGGLAYGRDRTGRVETFPRSPAEFAKHIRRESGNLKYEEAFLAADLRLPLGVGVIDTPGLNDISVNYDKDLASLETAWQHHGAVAAVLVSSVPPGVSGQDISLLQSLKKHFNDRVVVVLKQTQSSLTSEELRQAAEVWKPHGVQPIVITDETPSSGLQWGRGPLAELEIALERLWATGNVAKTEAASRLRAFLESQSSAIMNLSSVFETRNMIGTIHGAHNRPSLLPALRVAADQKYVVDYEKAVKNKSNESLLNLENAITATVRGSATGESHLKKLLANNKSFYNEAGVPLSIGTIFTRLCKENSLVVDKILSSYVPEQSHLASLREGYESLQNPVKERAKGLLRPGMVAALNLQTRERGLIEIGRTFAEIYPEDILLAFLRIWRDHNNYSSAFNAYMVPRLEDDVQDQLLTCWSKTDDQFRRNYRVQVDSLLDNFSNKWTDNWGDAVLKEFNLSSTDHALSRLEIETTGIVKVLQRLQMFGDEIGVNASQRCRTLLELPARERQHWLDITRRIHTADKANPEQDSAYVHMALGILFIFISFVSLTKGSAMCLVFACISGFCFLRRNSLISRGHTILVAKPFRHEGSYEGPERQLLGHGLVTFFVIISLWVVGANLMKFVPEDLPSSSSRTVQTVAQPVSCEATNSCPVASEVVTTIASEIGLTRTSQIVIDDFWDENGESVGFLDLAILNEVRFRYTFLLRDEYGTFPSSFPVTTCWRSLIDESISDLCSSNTVNKLNQNGTYTASYRLEFDDLNRPPLGSWQLILKNSENDITIFSQANIEIIDSGASGAAIATVPNATLTPVLVTTIAPASMSTVVGVASTTTSTSIKANAAVTIAPSSASTTTVSTVPVATTVPLPAFKVTSLKLRTISSTSTYFYVTYSDATVDKNRVVNYVLSCDNSSSYDIPLEMSSNSHTYTVNSRANFYSCSMYAVLRDGSRSGSATAILTVG